MQRSDRVVSDTSNTASTVTSSNGRSPVVYERHGQRQYHPYLDGQYNRQYNDIVPYPLGGKRSVQVSQHESNGSSATVEVEPVDEDMYTWKKTSSNQKHEPLILILPLRMGDRQTNQFQQAAKRFLQRHR